MPKKRRKTAAEEAIENIIPALSTYECGLIEKEDLEEKIRAVLKKVSRLADENDRLRRKIKGMRDEISRLEESLATAHEDLAADRDRAMMSDVDIAVREGYERPEKW